MYATAEIESPSTLGQGLPLGRGETRLDSVVVVRELSAKVPGVHADLGGRHGIWHPDMDRMQGLYYFHRHVCSMDRGVMDQWPRWRMKEDLCEATLDYALAHEDFPVVAMAPNTYDTVMGEAQTAFVMRRTIDQVESVGWAEVFWQVLHKVPGITVPWLAATFRVPMDWISGTKISPLSMSFEEAKRRGMVSSF